jgi:hypothetical protein
VSLNAKTANSTVIVDAARTKRQFPMKYLSSSLDKSASKYLRPAAPWTLNPTSADKPTSKVWNIATCPYSEGVR